MSKYSKKAFRSVDTMFREFEERKIQRRLKRRSRAYAKRQFRSFA